MINLTPCINCPDPKVCKAAGRHLQGDLYQKYISSDHWKKLLTITDDENRVPSTIEQVTNFGKALFKHTMAGSPKVSDEELKQRLLACETCDLVDKSAGEVWVCKVCRCPLQQNSLWPGKAYWATESCPHPKGNRWPVNEYSEQIPSGIRGCCGQR